MINEELDLSPTRQSSTGLPLLNPHLILILFSSLTVTIYKLHDQARRRRSGSPIPAPCLQWGER